MGCASHLPARDRLGQRPVVDACCEAGDHGV